MIVGSNNIAYKLEELDKKLNSILKLLEQGREDVLTSDQVCEKLDIGKTHLWKLDKEGVTEPLFLDENSRAKYYLLSDIIKIFTSQKFRRRKVNGL